MEATKAISYMMQPRLQMSEAWSYCFSTREISGALYHLVPTWFDRLRFFCNLVSFYFRSFWAITFFNSSLLVMECRSDLRMLSRILLELPEPLPMQLCGNVLERPKSQILMLQSSSIRMFAGFISRWMMLAECINFIAHKMLYEISIMCSWEKSPGSVEDDSTLFRSL